MAYGAAFLFYTRLMINFKLRHERYGGTLWWFIPVLLRAIFSTPTVRAAGIWIFSGTHIF